MHPFLVLITRVKATSIIVAVTPQLPPKYPPKNWFKYVRRANTPNAMPPHLISSLVTKSNI